MKRKSKKSNPIQAHKIEFYPKKDTQKKLKKLFGYRKYLYNRGLSIQKEMYQEYKSFKNNNPEAELELYQHLYPSYISLRDKMQSERKDWQFNYPSRMISYAAEDIIQAIENAFNPKMKKAKFPKYKVDTPNSVKLFRPIIVDSKTIKLSGSNRGMKFKQKIKLAEEIRFEGRLLDYCFVSRKNGRWYISLPYELTEEEIIKKELEYKNHKKEKTAVDVNVGHFNYKQNKKPIQIKTFTQEMNFIFDEVKYYNKVLITKKKRNKDWKLSKTYQKTKEKLALSYYKLYNLQEELLNILVKEFHKNFYSIVLEDLNVNEMKEQKFAPKNLQRSLFGRFKTKMKMKSTISNVDIILADKYFPSTQRCSVCGFVKTGEDKLGLYGDNKGNKHNEYVCYNKDCPKYNIKVERDENAVENLLQYSEDLMDSIKKIYYSKK